MSYLRKLLIFYYECLMYAGQFQEIYTSVQTATEIIPAPGKGKRIVIKYGSIRTDANAGKAWVHPSDNSNKWFWIPVSNLQSFLAGNLYLCLPENTALQFTSEGTGTNEVDVVMLYSVVSSKSVLRSGA